ncbi:MAG: hypothetical protein CM15mV32_0350 [Caudoviricetes sp.]|nr:MAG: hypothetical protein CM15mV32_0350 [Caudoviricetes sp.]
MLQKIVNGIAIASGVVSLTVVGAAGYVFIRKDAIIDNIKSKVMESVLPGGLSNLGTGALGGALDIPDLGDNPMAAPDSPTPDAPAAGPKSPTSVGLPPLGF